MIELANLMSCGLKNHSCVGFKKLLDYFYYVYFLSSRGYGVKNPLLPYSSSTSSLFFSADMTPDPLACQSRKEPLRVLEYSQLPEYGLSLSLRFLSYAIAVLF